MAGRKIVKFTPKKNEAEVEQVAESSRRLFPNLGKERSSQDEGSRVDERKQRSCEGPVDERTASFRTSGSRRE